MSGDPYREAAEPVVEIYDDFAPFRRELARQRRLAFLVVGYALALMINFIAMPLLSQIETIAVINLLCLGTLGLFGRVAQRNAS